MSKKDFTHHINTRKIQRTNTRLSNAIITIVLCIIAFISAMVFTACDGTSDKRPIIDLSSIQGATIDGTTVYITDCHGETFAISADIE